MINARDRADHYRSLGMEIEEGSDEPRKIYPPHSHERTVLYTVNGSLRLERDGTDAVDLLPGMEVVVESGQQHTGVVGPDGWTYIAAWDPEEAKLFKH